MLVSVSNQAYVFLNCILGGLLVGLMFDIFRLSRKYLSSKDIVTYIEDILFWVLVGAIVLFTAFFSNNGEIRGYVLLGIFLGAVFYFLVFSRLILNTLSRLVDFVAGMLRFLVRVAKGPLKRIAGVVSIPFKSLYKRMNILEMLFTKIWKLVRGWRSKLRRGKKIIKEKM